MRISVAWVVALFVLTLGFSSDVYASERMYASFYAAPAAKIAASRDLPRGKKLRLTNPDNGRHVEVVIEDYGPAAWTKCDLDISDAYARYLGFTRAGHAWLTVDHLN